MLNTGNTVMIHACPILTLTPWVGRCKSSVLFLMMSGPMPWELILPMEGLSERGEHWQIPWPMWFAVTRSNNVVGMLGEKG